MTEPRNIPQDRSEQEQRERLTRYTSGQRDAAPVPCFERGDLP